MVSMVAARLAGTYVEVRRRKSHEASGSAAARIARLQPTDSHP
jgi:hypothetical protein